MLFKVLLAASPSFNDEELFCNKLNYLLQNKPQREFHCLTQQVFTKICTDYSKCIVHPRDFVMHGPQTTMILYNRVADIADAIIVFWDGETTNEERLIKRCQADNIKHCVVRYESLKQQLAREKKTEVKRKKITAPLSIYSRQRYLAAHLIWFKQQYPAAYKDELYSPPKILPINSGSRMDTFIVNFLVWSGWSATIVRATGRQVNGKWIPGTTKKGTFDVTATIKGWSVKIETKHSTDTPSPDQLKMQERERRAGAIAEIVYSIDDFFVLYDKILNL